MKDQSGFVVLEAVGPVKKTALSSWIQRGREKAFAVYRLTASYQNKTEEVIKAALTFLGRPYDIHYSFDDEKIYCSELVFKAFQKATGEELGQVKRLGDLNWQPNEAFIRQLEGGLLPLDRAMITPRDLSEAKQLQLVFRRIP
jgi:uncharacterized protein YycO